MPRSPDYELYPCFDWAKVLKKYLQLPSKLGVPKSVEECLGSNESNVSDTHISGLLRISLIEGCSGCSTATYCMLPDCRQCVSWAKQAKEGD